MLNTQARGRVANSAAASLLTSKPAENSAAGEHDKIKLKLLILNKLLALRGGFLTPERRLLPDSRESGSFTP